MDLLHLVKLPTIKELKHIKNLIENCLMIYMTKKATMDTLQGHFSIHPFLTHLVWEELEKANKAFFKDYHCRLELLEQIQTCNQLLSKVYQMSVGQIAPSNVVDQVPTSSTPAYALCQRNSSSAAIDQEMYQRVDDSNIFSVMAPQLKCSNQDFTQSNVGQIAPSNVANQVPTSSTPAYALCQRNTSSAVINQEMYQRVDDSNIFSVMAPHLKCSNQDFTHSSVGQIAPSNVAHQVPTSSTPAMHTFGEVIPYVECSNRVFPQSNDALENQCSHPSLSFQANSGLNYSTQAPRVHGTILSL